ncbi:DNA-binding response regulator in two-component regulatory system with CusS [Candidatus Methylobacter favarea]|uniref:DNA-binding response regulator in two-component regulatory system with CusS n=1 Tax=Candidatus Methylobacter favarea TaxID=2707345 RepID=A0A8S0WGN7_9GAMM|nr:response regulator transcription factor [Candidatus Methylobacter favarea]CAA9889299.1 DNA-binding response regulator in two-component regulatory system with CusS [Candidatus Methylobacter favarea]
MKLLLIEDDNETGDYVSAGLKQAGHTVDLAKDGYEGLLLAREGNYDLLVVDRMLPHLDGLTLIKILRSSGCTAPVLFLTTMGGIDDRVEGLNAGGDDYLVKPFAFSELDARVNALLRRPRETVEQKFLQVQDLEIDLLKRTVKRAGRLIDLQPTEFRLLEYLVRHAGQVVTRTMLLENVWDFHFDPQTNIVETHISRLRSKLNAGSRPDLILTVRGAGYMIHETA